MLVVTALGATAFWQVTDQDNLKLYWNSYQQTSLKKQPGDRKPTPPSLCQRYSAITPLGVSLKGKIISVKGINDGGFAGQVASLAKQALPETPVFANGILEQRVDQGALSFIRTDVPPDAITVSVTTRQIEQSADQSGGNTPGHFEIVTVSDSTGQKLGQWQGFMSGQCGGSQETGQNSLLAFLASQRPGLARITRRSPAFQELQFEVSTVKTKHVARPEDFSVPASMPACTAALVKDNNRKDPTLQITTATGKFSFRSVQVDQTLPAVTCNEDRTGVVFRTATHVSVVTLDRNGYILGVVRIPLKKTSAREVFRDTKIEKDQFHVTLAALEVDKKGTLTASEGRLIATTLGTTPEPVQAHAETMGLFKHSGCKAPPALDREIHVHELPRMGVAYEYVHIPGHEPIPFRNIVIDAPLQSVAVSFPETTVELVWLIQATPGTDLRYVEISGTGTQTVLMRGADTTVNIATDATCQKLFGEATPSRRNFSNLHLAYKNRDQKKETIRVVLLANGSPFVTADYTFQALSAFGYQHISSLTGYFLQLKSEGAIQEATFADYQRYNDYFYEQMPLGRKIKSWFSADPALNVGAQRGGGAGYVVKRAFPLPKHPDDSARQKIFLIEKGAPAPQGDLKPYNIIDANTLSCVGASSQCPWAK